MYKGYIHTALVSWSLKSYALWASNQT